MSNLIFDYWKLRPWGFRAACGEGPNLKKIEPKEGNFIILTSEDWRVFENGKWREMTRKEKIEASL